ncbi:hypothetical protein Q8A64_02775 [Oxalobacteraceae bacterium R-40]|uniref:Uncharacterized protein n=1 Tax=Keguizhuia sedimenti TaxID=3064264 RepID=A0ABU1BKH0_9BURK|nr:hypothetical protein [Oxalobacteraceae bacterium R-40]
MKSLTYSSASVIQRQHGYVSRKDRPKALVCMALSAIISVSAITLIIAVFL